MYKFNDLQNMMHAGAAILHAHRYHQEEIKEGLIWEVNDPLAVFLFKLGLITLAGPLTALGNEVFACPDLIRYYHLIQSELCSQTPRKMGYDYLRSGLNQHIQIDAIEYMDFIHSLEFVPQTVCDLGGGGGMYLQLVCEHFGSEAYLVDKDTTYAEMNLAGDYYIEQEDFLASDWDSKRTYDMVLLNEVLHLLHTDDVPYLLRVCHQLLNDGGWLIIGETVPSPALDWRLSLLSGGRSISLDEMMNLLNDEFKAEFGDDAVILTLDTHYYIALRRI